MSETGYSRVKQIRQLDPVSFADRLEHCSTRFAAFNEKVQTTRQRREVYLRTWCI
jgi:hypothetical protein